MFAVTGAAGWIGSRVAEALEGRGAEVRRFDRRLGPRVLRGDVTERRGWEEALAGVDTIIHLAALVGDLGEPREFWRVNVEGTRNVAEAAAAVGATRFVHVSSIVVYGPHFPEAVTESAPVRPSGAPYTDSKIASEHAALAASASAGFDVTIVRPGDVYGPGSHQWVVRQIDLLRRRLLALPRGGGVIAPVFIDDLVSGILAAAAEPGAAGEILNISADRGVGYAAFVDHFASALGVRAPRVPDALARGIATATYRAYRALGRPPPIGPEVLEYVTHGGAPSIEKAERLLGWRPTIGLEEGMAATLAWCRREGLLDAR